MFKIKSLKFWSQVYHSTFDALVIALAVGLLGYFVTKAPELHNSWIRTKVGNRTYAMRIKPNGGGGTGFAMKAKSGITYIVTNDHICEHAENGQLLVTTEDGRTLWRNVIERSDFSDLCVVEGMPGDEGLTLGHEPRIGDTIEVVGHPRLRPLSLAKGELTGVTDIPILSFIMKSGDPLLDLMLHAEDKACDSAKNVIMEEPISIMGVPAGSIKFCINLTKDAYMSTVVIYPGNSGSPVVDYWGNVIGVAFASDDTHWAAIVSRADLIKLLAKY
jgi:S1-C subfamily serine protease